jgi:hypothetical protein
LCCIRFPRRAGIYNAGRPVPGAQFELTAPTSGTWRAKQTISVVCLGHLPAGRRRYCDCGGQINPPAAPRGHPLLTKGDDR